MVDDGGGLSFWPRSSGVGDAVSESISSVGKRSTGRNDYQQMKLPVLIYVGEPDQLGEGMQLSSPDSLVRLKRFKPVNVYRPDVFQEAIPIEVLEVSHFGKLNIVPLCLLRLSAKVINRQLASPTMSGQSSPSWITRSML